MLMLMVFESVLFLSLSLFHLKYVVSVLLPSDDTFCTTFLELLALTSKPLGATEEGEESA
jgi:hypothetical protein